MPASISSPEITALLDKLYADAAEKDPVAARAARDAGASGADFYRAMLRAYLPVARDFGNILYMLVRSSRAETVVEFGTSLGISTIFLAAALRDNGRGKLITTEFHPEKVEQARSNLREAGLEEWVEFRTGDALQTLAGHAGEIDMIFLDGPKGLYADVLTLLEPSLRSGGIVTSDNTDHEGMEDFLARLRDRSGSYLSSGVLTLQGGSTRGHEISIKK